MPYCLNCGRFIETNENSCPSCGFAKDLPDVHDLTARPSNTDLDAVSQVPPPTIKHHSHVVFYVIIAALILAGGVMGSQVLINQNALSKTRTDLASTQSSISQAQQDLSDTEKKITDSVNAASQAQTQLVSIRSDQGAAQSKSLQIQNAISLLKTSPNWGYGEFNPTYQQVLTLLSNDQTDTKAYSENGYNCWDFSVDTMIAAMKQHYRCGLVAIDYIGPGHAIIAFNTSDAGIVYFEPQSDERVYLRTGSRYYQCIVAAPGYYYPVPSYDDTILGFDVVWN